MCGPQIRLCLFTFRPIASKELNSLTTINTFSWLCGELVTHPLWVQEDPGSIPAKDFYDWFFVLLLCFYFLSKTTLFVTTFCNSFCNVNLFSIHNILQDLWLIMRVWRYRPNIFKQVHFYTGQTKAPKEVSQHSIIYQECRCRVPGSRWWSWRVSGRRWRWWACRPRPSCWAPPAPPPP